MKTKQPFVVVVALVVILLGFFWSNYLDNQHLREAAANTERLQMRLRVHGIEQAQVSMAPNGKIIVRHCPNGYHDKVRGVVMELGITNTVIILDESR